MSCIEAPKYWTNCNFYISWNTFCDVWTQQTASTYEGRCDCLYKHSRTAYNESMVGGKQPLAIRH